MSQATELEAWKRLAIARRKAILAFHSASENVRDAIQHAVDAAEALRAMGTDPNTGERIATSVLESPGEKP